MEQNDIIQIFQNSKKLIDKNDWEKFFYYYEYPVSNKLAKILYSAGVNFLSHMETVPKGLFRDAEYLTNLIVPRGIEKIEASAFLGCKNLTSIHLPDTLVTIEEGAFKGCTSLQEITISKNVDYIMNDAFEDCINLRYVIFEGTPKIIRHDVFLGCSKLVNKDNIKAPFEYTWKKDTISNSYLFYKIKQQP